MGRGIAKRTLARRPLSICAYELDALFQVSAATPAKLVPPSPHCRPKRDCAKAPWRSNGPIRERVPFPPNSSGPESPRLRPGLEGSLGNSRPVPRRSGPPPRSDGLAEDSPTLTLACLGRCVDLLPRSRTTGSRPRRLARARTVEILSAHHRTCPAPRRRNILKGLPNEQLEPLYSVLRIPLTTRRARSSAGQEVLLCTKPLSFSGKGVASTRPLWLRTNTAEAPSQSLPPCQLPRHLSGKRKCRVTGRPWIAVGETARSLFRQIPISWRWARDYFTVALRKTPLPSPFSSALLMNMYLRLARIR